jgi:copper(I)-binding protein
VLLLVLAVLVITACGADDSGSGNGTPELAVSDAWTRAVVVDEDTVDTDGTATPATEATVTTAVYLSIENNGEQDDQLLSVAAAVADAAEMHESTITDGVMQMRQAQVVDVPAGESVVFEPGGLHVMLIGVHTSLEPGDRLELDLTFAQAGNITVSVAVRDL